MSKERDKENAPPSYSALTEGELLTLTLEQKALEEGAKEALAAEMRRRGLGETEIASFQRHAQRSRTRQARWHRVQWLRLRELFSVLLIWPGMLFIPFFMAFGLILILDPVLRNVLGLNQHQVNLYEEITAISAVLLCAVVAVALILSDRSGAVIRRWLRGRKRKLGSQEQKLRSHQRICPARNLGNALLLFLCSLYLLLLSVRDVAGWRFLRGQSPAFGWTYVDTASAIFLIVFFSYLLAKAPCLREKLWLAFATGDFLLDVPKHLLRNLNGRELSHSSDISVVLWAVATLVALSFVKSAWQAPPAHNLEP